MYGVTCSRSDGRLAFFHASSKAVNEKTSTSRPLGYVLLIVLDVKSYLFDLNSETILSVISGSISGQSDVIRTIVFNEKFFAHI